MEYDSLHLVCTMLQASQSRQILLTLFDDQYILGPVITDEMESKLITHCFSLITVGLITIVSYHNPLNDPREEGRSIMLRAFGLEWVQIPPLAFLRSLLQFTYMIPCSLLVNAQEPSIFVIICI